MLKAGGGGGGGATSSAVQLLEKELFVVLRKHFQTDEETRRVVGAFKKVRLALGWGWGAHWLLFQRKPLRRAKAARVKKVGVVFFWFWSFCGQI